MCDLIIAWCELIVCLLEIIGFIWVIVAMAIDDDSWQG